jgi:hypothetical protein
MSGRFRHAEGWRRHLHLGFSADDTDPLAEALGKHYLINSAYEAWLQGIPAPMGNGKPPRPRRRARPDISHAS